MSFQRAGTVETAELQADPEVGVLLYCAKHRSEPQGGADLPSLLQKGVDWPRLWKVAESHGMLPLLHRVMSASPGAMPEASGTSPQATGQSETVRSLYLTEELFRILDGLDARQIPAVPYKGPVLAMSAYGDVGLRGFRDLDILVPKQDMFRAKEVLLSQGYEPSSAEEEGPAGEHTAHFASAWAFVRPADGIAVDLQWKATFFKGLSSPVERGDFWERLEHRSLAGRTVRVMPAETLLQVLCIHGCRHLWERLIWICDVAALIESEPDLDWERVMAEAESQGNRRVAFIGLLLANELLGTAVPTDVLDKAKTDKVACKLAGQARERLCFDAARPIRALEARTFHLQMLERFGDRVRYFQHFAGSLVAPNDRDRAVIPLPQGLSFLYYAIRPVRLLLRYGLVPLRLPGKIFSGT